jgi:hypothetical protein
MDSNSGYTPKQPDDKWRGLSSTITRLLKQVDAMIYDGITANERARASLIAYPINLREPFRATERASHQASRNFDPR